MDLLKYVFTLFSDLGHWLTGQVGRPNQGPVDLTVDRRAQSCARLAAQWAGRPGGRPELRAVLFVLFGRPGGRPAAANGQKLTIGRSTGRSTGSAFLAEFAANGYIFLGAINTPLMASFL